MRITRDIILLYILNTSEEDIKMMREKAIYVEVGKKADNVFSKLENLFCCAWRRLRCIRKEDLG